MSVHSEPVIIDREIFRRNERSFWICFSLMWIAILALILVCVWGFSMKLSVSENKTAEAVPSTELLKRVNFIKSKNPKISDNQAYLIAKESEKCSEISEVSATLFLVLVDNESSFDPYAISPKFALGLTQINSNDWPDATFDVQGSMRSGCRKLIYYITESKGNVKKALALYNGTKKKPNDAFARKVLDAYIKLEKGS